MVICKKNVKGLQFCPSIIECPNQYVQLLGLKVNYDKSKIFPIGSIKHTILPLYTRINIKLSTKNKTLGINHTAAKCQNLAFSVIFQLPLYLSLSYLKHHSINIVLYLFDLDMTLIKMYDLEQL